MKLRGETLKYDTSLGINMKDHLQLDDHIFTLDYSNHYAGLKFIKD